MKFSKNSFLRCKICSYQEAVVWKKVFQILWRPHSLHFFKKKNSSSSLSKWKWQSLIKNMSGTFWWGSNVYSRENEHRQVRKASSSAADCSSHMLPFFIPEPQALGCMCQLSKPRATQSQRQHLLDIQESDNRNVFTAELSAPVHSGFALEIPFSYMASAFRQNCPQIHPPTEKCPTVT